MRGGEERGNDLEPQHKVKDLSKDSTPLEFTYNFIVYYCQIINFMI